MPRSIRGSGSTARSWARRAVDEEQVRGPALGPDRRGVPRLLRHHLERHHARVRARAGHALLDPVVPIGEGRHLGQVRDAEDLPSPRDVRQHPPHRLRHGAADPRVHLVEHVRGDGVLPSQGSLHGEEEARQLTPRGDPRERARRLAGVRRDEELRALGACPTECSSLTSLRQPCRFSPRSTIPAPPVSATTAHRWLRRTWPVPWLC